MKSKMEELLWKAYFGVQNFMNDEKGDSNMVAVIVLIAIIILVAGIFRESLMGAVRTVMDNFTEFIEQE
ncbi:Flp1 family type IVb pilin [Blautia sp. An81]|mgnify:FL=1|uniref:Flp1 family type IVb pilin n=1 Tax=Blautia sp. An81 TaxID=1965659 RepID=UPI000B397278|nr:Flp1 family type IVb pilin [Blautia sp. An81]OUN31966.1 hypothetical protein B5G33_00950 [Blautia sp. An81]